MASKSQEKSVTPKQTDPGVDLQKQIQKYVQIFDEQGLTTLVIETSDLRLKLSRQPIVSAQPAPIMIPQPMAHAVVTPSAPVAAASTPPASPAPQSAPVSSGRVIKSPMVGTFYSAGGPGLPPFVKPGDIVNPDTTVCIIEAMKMMNEIKAEQSGRIKAMLVNNEDAVQPDQPLFELE